MGFKWAELAKLVDSLPWKNPALYSRFGLTIEKGDSFDDFPSVEFCYKIVLVSKRILGVHEITV